MKKGVKFRLAVMGLAASITLGGSMLIVNANQVETSVKTETTVDQVKEVMPLHQGQTIEDIAAFLEANQASSEATGTSVQGMEETGGPEQIGAIIAKVGNEFHLQSNGQTLYNETCIYDYLGKKWYVKNGVVDTSVTRFVKVGKQYIYFSHGVQDMTAHNTFHVHGEDVCYIRNSIMDTTTTGIVYNSVNNNWYYVKKGVWQQNYNASQKGTVNGVTGKWYVQGGRVKLEYTGVHVGAKTKGDRHNRWYIVDGKVDEVRSALITYACQHIGNKYVYGGTNIKKGIDCSAFVQTVYKKYGVNISRTAAAQCSENKGRYVSLDEAIPGDLVFYHNGDKVSHVAMYIGKHNGKHEIVHASNDAPYPQGGIKVSNAEYKTIYKIKTYTGFRK